jgi:kumamolisin
MDDAFQDAAALGITVCCASGDNGSSDGERDGLQHVDFPASSPFALACGGTHLEGTGSSIGSEVAWNDTSGGATGGGVSDMFDMPAWQASANIPHSANHDHRKGRGVPDVSGDADPATGYQVLVDGQRFVIGGTSAVAPLWAALIALINQKRGKPIGYLNPVVYGAASGNGAFRDILKGENGAYGAHAGWDACTGLGTPNGAQLMKHLS